MTSGPQWEHLDEEVELAFFQALLDESTLSSASAVRIRELVRHDRQTCACRYCRTLRGDGDREVM